MGTREYSQVQLPASPPSENQLHEDLVYKDGSFDTTNVSLLPLPSQSVCTTLPAPPLLWGSVMVELNCNLLGSRII